MKRDAISIAQVLSALPPKQNGRYQCPACGQWHLTVEGKGGKVLVHCFTPDCKGAWEAIVGKINGHAGAETATVEWPGLTLERYVAEKGFGSRIALEQFFDVHETMHKGAPVVAFPYGQWVDDTWVHTATKIRGGSSHQTAWLPGEQGKKIIGPYYTRAIRQVEDIFICEGESDVHTLTLHGLAAVGISGAKGWKDEYAEIPPIRDAQRVFICQEPDADGPKFVEAVRKGLLGKKIYAVKFRADAPDPNALHLKHLAGLLGDTQLEKVAALLKSEEFIRALLALLPSGIPAFKIVMGNALEEQFEPYRWLWPDRIPKDMLTVFFGMPGVGKTTTLWDIVARVSKGEHFPYCPPETAARPAKVIILEAEEPLKQVAGPKLKLAGANMHNLIFIESTVQPNGGKQPFALDRDLESLQGLLEQHPDIALIVFDPMSSYLGDIETNKNKEVRPLLERVSAFAEENHVTIIGNGHFNKNIDQAALHRFSGGSAWVEVPRAVWAFVREPQHEDPQQERLRLMLNGKPSLTKNDEGLKFRLRNAQLTIKEETVNLAVVEWLGEVTTTLDEELSKSKPGFKPEKTEACMAWLRDFLANGPQPAGDHEIAEPGTVFGESKGKYHYNTVYEAAKRLGVRKPKQGRKSYWELASQPLLEG